MADLADSDAVRGLAPRVDGVIHLASPGDVVRASIDEAVVTGVLAALAGSDEPNEGARRLLGWRPKRPTLLEQLAGDVR